MKIVFGLTAFQLEKLKILTATTGTLFGQIDESSMTLTFEGDVMRFAWIRQACLCLVFGRRAKDFPEPLEYIPDPKSFSWVDLLEKTRSIDVPLRRLADMSKRCYSNHYNCDGDCSRCVASNSVLTDGQHIAINNPEDLDAEMAQVLKLL